MRSSAGERPRGLASIERSLVKLRVLHYTDGGRMSSAAILERLRQQGCAMTSRSLGMLLERLCREGWIELKLGRLARYSRGQEWSLTFKGRQVLGLAKGQLRLLAGKSPRTQKHKQNHESVNYLSNNQPQRHDLPGSYREL